MKVSLSIGIGLFALGCCLSILIRETLINTDRNHCYQRLSEELGIAPSYGKIRSELYSQLQNKLKPGMCHDEVLAALQEISPISTKWKMTRLDGGINEYVILEACSFQRNSFPFLLIYSPGEVFEKVVNYVDD